MGARPGSAVNNIGNVVFHRRVDRHLHSWVGRRQPRSHQATTRHAGDRRPATTLAAAIANTPRMTSFARRWWRHRGDPRDPPGHVTARRMRQTVTSLTMSRSQGNGRSVFLNFRRAREIHRQTDEFVGQFKGILLKYIYCCKYVELFVVRRTAKSVCSLKIPHTSQWLLAASHGASGSIMPCDVMLFLLEISVLQNSATCDWQGST